MAEYRVTGPDGTKYKVTGPDGATDEQVLSQVKAYKPAGATQPQVGAGAPSAPSAPSGDTPGGAATGRIAVPRPREVEDSTTDFITGNLNKGIAGAVGMPVDTAANALNLGAAGIHAYRSMTPGGRDPGIFTPPIQNPPGGSQSIESLMRRGGMVTPAAEPESIGGRYAAAALQMAPSAAMGRPNLRQVPRALTAAATSGLGAQAATDIGGPEYAGVGAMLPSARSLAKPPSIGERATAERQAQAFGKARELGIPVPPREMKPDKTHQRLQDAANKDLGQPEGADFSPKTLQNYRNAHWADYEAVIKDPALKNGVVPNARFQADIQSIGQEIAEARNALPETFKGVSPVLKLLGEYGYVNMPSGVNVRGMTAPPRQQPIPANVAMRAIKKLRADAATNIASDNPEQVNLGMTQRRLAGSIETLIEDNLGGNSDLMAKFRQARTAIAKSHDVESALDPVTGKIVPQKLAALQNEGRPLSGGLSDIAQVGGAFPGAVRPRPASQDELFTKKVTPMAVTHPGAMAAHWTTRMWDPITTSRPYQAFVVDPRTRLSPEAQQALRYMAAGQAANRRPGDEVEDEIPTPPISEKERRKKEKVGAMRGESVGVRG